jgi:hypothetical protein
MVLTPPTEGLPLAPRRCTLTAHGENAQANGTVIALELTQPPDDISASRLPDLDRDTANEVLAFMRSQIQALLYKAKETFDIKEQHSGKMKKNNEELEAANQELRVVIKELNEELGEEPNVVRLACGHEVCLGELEHTHATDGKSEARGKVSKPKETTAASRQRSQRMLVRSERMVAEGKMLETIMKDLDAEYKILERRLKDWTSF